MQYERMVKGFFLSRPNRFIAYVDLNGVRTICHVRNTGRCAELLKPGATVYMQEALPGTVRKTRFDLIAVEKGSVLVNMDSQAPNQIAWEYLQQLYGGSDSCIEREVVYGQSRLDFRIRLPGNQHMLIEVKGVTLEHNGIAAFPDAPTERGVRHLRELEHSVGEGYKAMLLFIVQMQGVVHCVVPNDITHRAFGDALRAAVQHGVMVRALDCFVTPGSIAPRQMIPVKLDGIPEEFFMRGMNFRK